MKIIVCCCFLFANIVFAHAQARLGGMGLFSGININALGAGFQTLPLPEGYRSNNFVSFRSIDGYGAGAVVGAEGFYMLSPAWSAYLRAGWDMRGGTATDYSIDPNPTVAYSMNYLFLSPGVRTHLASALEFSAGISFGFPLSPKFTYTEPGFATIENATLTDAVSPTLGVHAGISYEIPLNNTSTSLAPFVEIDWLTAQRNAGFVNFQQNALTAITARVGLSMRLSVFGNDDKPEKIRDNPFIEVSIAVPPKGLVITRKTQDYYPILPYVFFDAGQSNIPLRYSALSSESAKRFTEGNLQTPNYGVGIIRRDRHTAHANAYYNVMNIVAARMRKHPSSTMRISGIAAGNSPEEALSSARKVRDYMVNNQGIAASRVQVDYRPESLPLSDKDLASKTNDLAEYRRVELMLNNSPLAPLEFTMMENSPIDQDIIVTLSERDNIAYWTLTAESERSHQKFGPFRELERTIDPSLLLGVRPSAYFSMTISAVKKDSSSHTAVKEVYLERKRSDKIARRYTMLFHKDETELQDYWQKTLREKVAADITDKDYVILHAHSDKTEKIGKQIVKERFEHTKSALEKSLTALGKKTTILKRTLNEEDFQSIMREHLPEGRHYLRSVVVEIIPYE